jgi:hypothetical protein
MGVELQKSRFQRCVLHLGFLSSLLTSTGKQISLHHENHSIWFKLFLYHYFDCLFAELSIFILDGHGFGNLSFSSIHLDYVESFRNRR